MSHEISQTFRFGKFHLSEGRQMLYLGDREIPLAAKTYDVLQYFLRNPGRVVTKEELLNAVWANAHIEESNLAQHIFRIRKAFEAEPTASQIIRTVPGRGYLFNAEVSQDPPPSASIRSLELPQPAPASGVSPVEIWRERTHLVLEEFEIKPTPTPMSRFGRWLPRSAVRNAVIAATVLAVTAAGLVSWKLWGRHLHSSSQGFRQLVLADFVNATGDATFDRTLKHALEIDLAQSPYLDVLSERAGVDTLGTMGRKPDTAITADVAREICERTNREVLIAGTLSAIGRKYLLTLEGSDCTTGKSLATAKAETDSSEGVLEALDAVTDRLRRQLDESTRSIEGHDVPLREATTSSLEALKAYSTGQYFQSQGRSHGEIIAALERAIELDPQFAMAYRQLAVENSYIGQYAMMAKYMTKAFELSGHTTTREQLLIRAGYYTYAQGDWAEGIRTYELMASVYPHDPVPIVNLEDAYTTIGQYDRALDAGERGARFFPRYALVFENLGTIYRCLNRFDDAAAAERHAAEVGHGDTGLDLSLAEIAFARHDQSAIDRESRWFDAHEDGSTVWYYPAFRGDGAASLGRYRQALGLYLNAYRSASRAHMPEAADVIVAEQAATELALGLPDATRASLAHLSEQAAANPEIVTLKAQLGDPSAERFLALHAAPTPDTLLTYVYVPRVRAAAAMQHARPLEAIAALEASRPYEMRDYSVPTLRGDAYLQAARPDMAAVEFNKILANPGVNPTSVLYPLAHLRMARALAMQHDALASRREYEAFFAYWRDADPELPVLQKAHLEYAQLRTH